MSYIVSNLTFCNVPYVSEKPPLSMKILPIFQKPIKYNCLKILYFTTTEFAFL